MTTCAPRSEDPFRCPTKWELWRQILALLPRGRAWQTHEDVAERWEPGPSSQLGTFEVGQTQLGGEPDLSRLTVLQQYWAAYAEVLEYLHTRACALLEEFFCATTVEMRGEWGTDYGFPDACEPWDTLCDKVSAQGGATCAYLAGLAARQGYTIECIDCDGRVATAGCLEAGLTPLDCDCQLNQIRIRILSAPDPIRPPVFEAGEIVAGCTDPCSANPQQVICLIERYKPAHVRAIYEVVINDN